MKKMKKLHWVRIGDEYDVWEHGSRKNAIMIYPQERGLMFEGKVVAEKWNFPEAYKNAREILEKNHRRW